MSKVQLSLESNPRVTTMKRAILAILLITTYTSSSAQETGFTPASEINQEWEELSGAYAECAAYYRFVYFALESSGETETAAAYRDLEDNSMLVSLVLANGGRDRDMAIEVTNSRIELYMQQMKEETNNRNENISILINKHNASCMALQQEPSEVVIDALAEASQD